MKIYYFKKIQNYHFEKYYKIFSIISLKHAIHKYKHKRKKNIESHGLRDHIAYLVT